MKLLTLAVVLLLPGPAFAQVPAVAAASNLPDGRTQLMTLFDYEAGAYQRYSVTKNGSSIRLFDFQTSSFKTFDVKQNGALMTVWDQASGFHTYNVKRFGSQITIFDPQHPGYQTLSLFTAAPMASAQTPSYGPSPLGSALQYLGAGLQQLARDHAVREQIEQQEKELAAMRAEIDQLKRQQEARVPEPARQVYPTTQYILLKATASSRMLGLPTPDATVAITAIASGWWDGPAQRRLSPRIALTFGNMSNFALAPIEVRVLFGSWGSTTLTVPALAPHSVSERFDVQAPAGDAVGEHVNEALTSGHYDHVAAGVSLKLTESQWSPQYSFAIDRQLVR